MEKVFEFSGGKFTVDEIVNAQGRSITYQFVGATVRSIIVRQGVHLQSSRLIPPEIVVEFNLLPDSRYVDGFSQMLANATKTMEMWCADIGRDWKGKALIVNEDKGPAQHRHASERKDYSPGDEAKLLNAARNGTGDDTIEQLAAYAHAAWAGWTEIYSPSVSNMMTAA